MSLAAESVGQVVNNWPAVVLAAVGVVGGWGTLTIQARLAARKGATTVEAVKEIKEQVTNGGTNLAATIGEVKTMLGEQRDDIGGLRKDIGGLRGELRDEREARVELARSLDDRLKQIERRGVSGAQVNTAQHKILAMLLDLIAYEADHLSDGMLITDECHRLTDRHPVAGRAFILAVGVVVTTHLAHMLDEGHDIMARNFWRVRASADTPRTPR